MESVDDIYNALIQRNRFKARYSTQGAGSASRTVNSQSAQIAVNMSASLEFTTGPRQVIDDSYFWNLEGEYRFALNNKFHDIGTEYDGEVSINDISEKTGGDSVRVVGVLIAQKGENTAGLAVCLKLAPFEKLTSKSIHKDDGYAQIDEVDTIKHVPFFENIESEILPVFPGLSAEYQPALWLDGWDFHCAGFTKLVTWQTKKMYASNFAYLLETEVVFSQEMAITDGDVLPTSDDCVPVIEAVLESGKVPVAGKEFMIRHPDGNLRSHVTDSKGRISLMVKDGEKYVVEELVDRPQKGEPRHQKTENA